MYNIISFIFVLGLATLTVTCSIMIAIVMDFFRGKFNRKHRFRR